MSIKDLLQHLQTAKTKGPVHRVVRGVTSEVERVQPGMVYVAISGADGGYGVQSAVERGATAVISEAPALLAKDAIHIHVDDARAAMAKAASLLHELPNFKVIGIAGGSQRTGIASLTRQILENAGIKTGLIGTSGTEFGGRKIPARNFVTPETAEAQETFAQMARNGCEACVLEITAEAMAEGRGAGLGVDILLFSSEVNGSLLSTQEKITLKPGGKAIFLNRQNQVFEHQQMIARAANAIIGREATSFDLILGSETMTCRLPLVGRQSIGWAVGAAAAALAAGLGKSEIISGLARVQSVPGRMERVEARGLAIQPCAVFLQRVRTDGELIDALTVVREITVGRLFLVLGCEGDRAQSERGPMGRTAALLADALIVTSDNSRSERPAAIAQEVVESFKAIRPHGFQIELDRRRAIELAVTLARATDTVLIAGKGDQRLDEVEGAIVPWDDADQARQALLAQRLRDIET